MNRLNTEQHRLYGLGGAGPDDSSGGSPRPDVPRHIDAAGPVRAMVLELAAPADWAATCAVWHGVQADLDLPAPAIAVNGRDGYQLWFSLGAPVPAALAMAFLDGVKARYLHGTKARRVTALPWSAPSEPSEPAAPAVQVPPRPVDSGIWSAFVAPDLAPMFADEPWLDMPPGVDGQASLLAGLNCAAPGDLERALQRLQPAADAAGNGNDGLRAPGSGAAAAADHGDPAPVSAPHAVRPAPVGACTDPRRFLLDVMNDPTVALALRIEAAKALLPFADGPSRD